MRRRTEAHRPMATDNNLRLNQAKTVEIVFYARGRHRAEEELPPSLPGIQHVATSKFLALFSVITCQWLDMSLHCWTPVQEHCTVYGFSEPMVFTIQDCLDEVFSCTALAKLLYASPAWSGFCSAADNGKLDRFLNTCRKLYRCQQLNQDIYELFNLTDQSLFSSLQKNSHHVLHRLLPAKSTQPYNLRPGRHSFSLTQKQSSYDDCNFITRMLFYDIY